MTYVIGILRFVMALVVRFGYMPRIEELTSVIVRSVPMTKAATYFSQCYLCIEAYI
jgi:hypothetical protein